MSEPAIDIGHLNLDQKLELIEELWESLDARERDAIPLTHEQREELDRRLDALEKKGLTGLTPDEVHARVRRPPS